MAEGASDDPVARYAIGALLAVPVQVLAQRVHVLAGRWWVSSEAMGETIDWLEQHGYVERLPDPSDGRATLVRRTELGWRVNRIAREQVEATQAEWIRALGEADFAPLIALLRRLVRLLDYPAGVAGHPRTLRT